LSKQREAVKKARKLKFGSTFLFLQRYKMNSKDVEA